MTRRASDWLWSRMTRRQQLAWNALAVVGFVTWGTLALAWLDGVTR